ncbi:MAG: limonene hydroxylase, partial [Bacillota bacterium]|nr:limonene hydroxylase [Bacillota bacterium]
MKKISHLKVMKLFSMKKTIPLLPWAGKKSIYEFIKEHIDSSGRLPYEFDDLPDSKEYFRERKIRWVGGALDSLMGGASKDANQQARMLYLLLRKEVSNPSDKNRRATYLFAMHHEVIGCVDSLLEMIRKGFAFNSNILKQEAIWLAAKSAHRGPTKLGIALMGLFQCEEHLELLSTLGKHDEFTLYSVVAMENGMENANLHLFELAKHIDGWGKINLLQRLEADSKDVKAWMLRKGCRNNIMNEYLAYTCAVKGDLYKALSQADIDMDLYKGAGEIVDALINGGPAEDIDDYKQSMPVIVNYLRHSKRLAS